MKIIVKIVIFISIIFGCHQPTPDITSIRKNFSDSSKVHNLQVINWEKTYHSLERKSLDSPMAVLSLLTELLHSHSYTSSQESDLCFLEGSIYYRIDSFRMAVNAYSEADPHGDGPKYLAARAGAYLKEKMPDSALADLVKASDINYDYKWNLGNYYEILGKKDSALSNYVWLYAQDSGVYKYCQF